jgi:uncharacterized protein (TIRG00374 family)
MDSKVRKQRIKKWVTFAVRWGIAIGGIALVLWNISFYDRVQVLDPETNSIQKVRVWFHATETESEFMVASPGRPARVVSPDDLWVRPDRTHVTVKLGDPYSPAGERVKKVRLLAVKPGEVTGAGRSVRQLLVDDPDSDRGLVLDPSRVVDGGPLTVNSPYVEIGINRLVRNANKAYLLAALFMLPLSYILTSIRWHLLLESLGIRLSFFRSLVLNLVGAFYNAFMPGTTGGDLIKAYYAARQTAEFRTRAVLSVLIDRAIGLMALILLGGAMAAYQWHIPDCRRVAIISGAVVGAALLGVVVFYSRRLRRWTGLDFILKRLPMQRQVQKAVGAMEMYRDRPLPLLNALLLSFPVHATAIISATFAGKAFGLSLPVFYYWVVVPVIALVGAIPISPQGAGVMEFFAVELTRRHGVSISQAFVLVMSIRLMQVFWNLVAGIFVLRGGYQAPTEKEQEAMEGDAGLELAVDSTSSAQGTEPGRADPIGAQARTSS